MVGDMAGTLSGATGAIIVFSLVKRYPALKEEWVALVVVAFISALTVGGKGCEQAFFFRTGQRHNTTDGTRTVPGRTHPGGRELLGGRK